MDIWEIVRRYKAGQTIRTISEALGYDRKTVRKYIRHLQEKGISLRDDTPIDKEKIVVVLREIAVETERPSDKQALLKPYLEELKEFIDKPSDMKPKWFGS